MTPPGIHVTFPVDKQERTMPGEVPSENRNGAHGGGSLTDRPARDFQTMIFTGTGGLTDTEGKTPCAVDLPSN